MSVHWSIFVSPHFHTASHSITTALDHQQPNCWSMELSRFEHTSLFWNLNTLYFVIQVTNKRITETHCCLTYSRSAVLRKNGTSETKQALDFNKLQLDKDQTKTRLRYFTLKNRQHSLLQKKITFFNNFKYSIITLWKYRHASWWKGVPFLSSKSLSHSNYTQEISK